MANSRRKCSYCKSYFKPDKPFPGPSAWCSPECASSLALERLLPKKRREERRKARTETRQQREALKTKPQLTREAQRAWNRYIRARDAGRSCASCGATPSNKFGGTMDCSHYRSVGAAPHLRFNVFNAAAACVRCNRELSGNVVALRAGLIERFGIDRVEALELDNQVRNFDKDYLRRIKAIFTRKARLLEKIRK